MNAGIDSSFLSARPQGHSCASAPTSGLDPLDRISRAHASASSGCASSIPAALQGCCRSLAEMIDRVIAKKVCACRIGGGDYQRPIGTETR